MSIREGTSPLAPLGVVTPQDEAVCLDLYRQEASPAKRKGWSSLLAYCGSKEACRLFMNSLTNEFTGVSISEGDEQALCGLLFWLGLNSDRSDEAFRFLMAASDQRFWEVHARWTVSGKFGIDSKARLTHAAIESLGLSSRPAALGFYEAIRARPDEETRACSGSVVRGVGWLDYTTRHGTARLRRWTFDTGNFLYWLQRPSTEWRNSDRAAEWLRWSNDE